MGSRQLPAHRRLIVWQKALRLVAPAYAVAGALPKNEQFELARQIRRAAVSIVANIAEGAGRRHRRDVAQFFGIARGSARELDALLAIVEVCGMVDGTDLTAALQLADEVSRMLTAMLRRLDPL